MIYYKHDSSVYCKSSPIDLKEFPLWVEISEAEAIALSNPEPSLKDLKTSTIVAVGEAYAAATKPLTDGYTQQEIDTWPIKAEAALLHQDGLLDARPSLKSCVIPYANNLGYDNVEDYLSVVLSSVLSLNTEMARLESIKKTLITQINTSESAAQIRAIDISGSF